MSESGSSDDWQDILSERLGREEKGGALPDTGGPVSSGSGAGTASLREAAATPPPRPPSPDRGPQHPNVRLAVPAGGATTGVIPGGAVPGRPKARPSSGTSPELVVRELSRQISARDETRALKILRGRTGSGLGLAAIMVLSSVAVFAGTYLWTQAARERGALRTRETDVRAPDETAPAAEHTARSPAGTPAAKAPATQPRSGGDVSLENKKKTRPRPEAGVEAARVTGPAGPRPEEKAPAKPEPESEAVLTELFPEPAEPEEDQTPASTIKAPGPSSEERSKPQADAWEDLVGPAFGPVAPAAEKDDQER